MRMKILVGILSLFLILNFASAIETQVTVKSIPNYDIRAAIQEPSGYWTYKTENTKEDGIATIKFSIESSKYKLILNLRQDGETIYKERFDKDFNSGEKKEFELYPVWYTPETENKTNETLEIQQNITNTNETLKEEILEETKLENKTTQENKEEKQEKITALVSAGEIIKSKTAQYIGGAIILILIIYFVSKKVKTKEKKPKEIRIKKLSELQANKENRIKEQEEKIKKAQTEIEEAKKEIEKIKGEDRIAEVKKRLIEDEKELMNLRRGDKKDENNSNEDKK